MLKRQLQICAPEASQSLSLSAAYRTSITFSLCILKVSARQHVLTNGEGGSSQREEALGFCVCSMNSFPVRRDEASRDDALAVDAAHVRCW